ncbi:hypothetical protein EfsSVR2281_17570 [Enterococcus faecalis]|nr:hypothetical protein EfsSVR2281_17570 [Enterococcus faecalis]
MKALVAINPRYKNSLEFKKMETVKFGSTNVLFGLVELNQPDFDINNLQNDDYILIKVKYFSCNYRDKSILLEAYISEKKTKIDYSFHLVQNLVLKLLRLEKMLIISMLEILSCQTANILME